MTTSTQRTGPLLRIEGSCEGCEHLSDDGGGAWCGAPGKQGNGWIGWRSGPTPAWCPELSAARLALARGIVAEAEPLTLPLPGDAAVNPKPATWDDGGRR